MPSLPRFCSQLLALLLFLAPTLTLAGDSPKPTPAAEVSLLIEQPRTDYARRRSELMKRIKEAEGSSGRRAIVVLRGADDPDIEGKFRQTNDFAYLTGVDVPAAYLVLLPDDDRATLYLPPRPRFGGGMNSPRPGPGSEAAEQFGFDKVESTERLLGDLFAAIGDPLVMRRGRSSTVVYTRAVQGRAASSGGAEAKLTQLLRDGAPNTELKEVDPILGEMRKAKSPAELELLRRAIAITGEAQSEVLRTIQPGVVEFALEGKIVGAFTAGGALRAGFPSIVGSGPNSTIPHYFLNTRRLQDGDLVVVDIGAEYKYYTADITRTYPASGKFTCRQREIYQLVLDAQKAVETEMKPGMTRLRDMTAFTREYFKKSPLRAKDEQGNEHTMDRFFIHGLGHYLGMDVHDVGSYDKPVQVGEVFTIEPGLYIKSENIGVRIEDDYLMTDHGPEKLSKDILSDPEEIERRIASYRSER
jgi:Xaa-Pro aminopeptidase